MWLKMACFVTLACDIWKPKRNQDVASTYVLMAPFLMSIAIFTIFWYIVFSPPYSRERGNSKKWQERRGARMQTNLGVDRPNLFFLHLAGTWYFFYLSSYIGVAMLYGDQEEKDQNQQHVDLTSILNTLSKLIFLISGLGKILRWNITTLSEKTGFICCDELRKVLRRTNRTTEILRHPFPTW